MEDEEKRKPPFDEAHFRPDGAMVFFGLLIQLGAIIWFAIYYLMLQRI